MHPLEETIGYQFKEPSLLTEALTHPSRAHEGQERLLDNQRLEYLGDAVIELAITHELFARLPEEREGMLTQMRAAIVSESGLAPSARRIELGSHLQLGKGEDTAAGRDRNSTLADAFEALAGAIFLDGGFEPARDFVLTHCREEIEATIRNPEANNPKGTLQEILQSTKQPSPPKYVVVSATGPDHDKIFETEIRWRSEILGKGRGATKQAAEVAAARSALHSAPIRRIQNKSSTDPTRLKSDSHG